MIENIDLLDPTASSAASTTRCSDRCAPRTRCTGTTCPDGDGLLERRAARRPRRREPRRRSCSRRRSAASAICDHDPEGAGSRHARRDDAQHGPAQAHALPQARQQGLHAAHDRRCSSSTSRTARPSSSTTSSSAAPATSSIDVAAELPLQAIAEIMGVPQEDRHMLFEWSNRMIGVDDPEYAAPTTRRRDRRSSCTCTPTSSRQKRRSRPARRHRHQAARRRDRRRHALARSSSTCSSCCSRSPATRRRATRPRTACTRCSTTPSSTQRCWRTRRSCGTGASRRSCAGLTPVMHFRRTATRDTEIRGQADQGGRQGRHLVHLGQPRRGRCSTTRSPSTSRAPPTSTSRFGGGGAALLPRRQPRPHGAATCILSEILDAHPRHRARRRARAPRAPTSSAASSTCPSRGHPACAPDRLPASTSV